MKETYERTKLNIVEFDAEDVIDTSGGEETQKQPEADYGNVPGGTRFDGKEFKKFGSDYKMIFDYRRFFMGTRYAAFFYSTKNPGSKVKFGLVN